MIMQVYKIFLIIMQLLPAISFKFLCKRLCLPEPYPQRDVPQVVQIRQPS